MVQPFPNKDSLRDFNLQGHFLIQANGQMLLWKSREGTNEFALASAQRGRLKEDAEGTYVEMDSAWKYIDIGKIRSLSSVAANPGCQRTCTPLSLVARHIISAL
jgi:hypothetical protein